MRVWVQSRYRVFTEGLILLLRLYGLQGEVDRSEKTDVALVDLSVRQPPFPHPPDLPTLAISRGDDQTAIALLERKYRGFVRPSDEGEVLARALRAVCRGEIWAERRLLTELLLAEEAPKLTPKQSEILQFLAKGMTNRAIGEALGIAEGTVKMHVTQVYSKLGVQSRAELLARILAK
jgi:DNA-binding NarL/FixJ family response regulator